MPVKRKITESEGVYFITFTCYQWNYCELADINLIQPLEKNAESTPHTNPGGETSAEKKYYITGVQGIYEVLNYFELVDINLTQPLEKNAESTPHTKPGGETSAEKR